MKKVVAVLIVASLVASACSLGQNEGSADAPWPGITDVPDPLEVFDPTLEGRGPVGYRGVVPRDQIEPVYTPSFVSAINVGWNDDALVIGVDLEGESRAYPVGFLTLREMVIDNHRGIPTLVTW